MESQHVHEQEVESQTVVATLTGGGGTKLGRATDLSEGA